MQGPADLRHNPSKTAPFLGCSLRRQFLAELPKRYRFASSVRGDSDNRQFER